MNIALIKRMMDACYQAKRVRDLLPALPDGVLPSFIQYLDAIQTLEQQGIQVKRNFRKSIRHQRCAEPSAPRRDPDRKGHGSSWSFDQADLP